MYEKKKSVSIRPIEKFPEKLQSLREATGGKTTTTTLETFKNQISNPL